MKHRWTMKELEEVTNEDLILALIRERRSEMSPYSPLATRLVKLERWAEQNFAKPRSQPSDEGAQRLELIEGANEMQKRGDYRKPEKIKPSKHRRAVTLNPILEAAIVKDYQNNVPTEIIKKTHNTSSGELYRVLHRHHIPLSRKHKQSALPEPKSTTKTVHVPTRPSGNYRATTEASLYLFRQTGRKRWANLVQKAEFEKCEAEVGVPIMKEAIDWALTSGIANIKSMITAARNRKGRKVTA